MTRITLYVFIFVGLMFGCSHKEVRQTERSSNRTNLIDSLLNEAVNSGQIPGAVAYIAKDGKEVYHKAFGYRKLESKTMLKKDDIFRMASMTKALTAVSILQLCERGLLFIDDDVSKYISEFRNPTVLVDVLPDSSFTSRAASSEITIRQLLTHTSGIGYGFQDDRYNALVIKNNISEGFEDDDRTSLENILRIAKLPLLHEPGDHYTYGLSYDVLGVIIAKVSGMRYDKYVHHYILQPLGMNSSYFVVPPAEQPRLVNAYEFSSKGLIPTTYPDTIYPRIPTRQYFSGGADLCSTAEDYGKFIQMVSNKGIFNNKRIIGRRFIEMMLAQGFSTRVTTESESAKGLMPTGTYGFGGFWDTYSWVDPKEKFVAVLLLQMYPGNQHRIHEKFQSVTYRVIEELN